MRLKGTGRFVCGLALAAARAAAPPRANAQVEREVAQARMTHELYNVLTPEQRAQLQAARGQREQRRQEFRTRRGARRGRRSFGSPFASGM